MDNKRDNVFKSSDLKKNNRWENFKSTENQDNFQSNNSRFKKFNSSESPLTSTNGSERFGRISERFKNFNSSGDGRDDSRFGRDNGGRDNGGRDNGGFGGGRDKRDNGRFDSRGVSGFGKKIYKNKVNKKENIDYFQNKKNATQRNVSLFDLKKETNIKQKCEKVKKDIVKMEEKPKMTEDEKNFILNQYCDDEEDAAIDDDQTNNIIDF